MMVNILLSAAIGKSNRYCACVRVCVRVRFNFYFYCSSVFSCVFFFIYFEKADSVI